jgi:hypothetical protein
MNREQIEKKAQEILGCSRDNCLECGGSLSVANGCSEFEHIMQMADWLLDHLFISVEDELPEIGERYSEYVLVRYISGGHNIACYCKETEEWIDGKDFYRIPIEITHWMEIPKINQDESGK